MTLGDGSTVTGDELLVAVGRTPKMKGLGLESSVSRPSGYVEVDAHCRVPGSDWLYVIGDLNGRAPFTHMAKYQARSPPTTCSARAGRPSTWPTARARRA